MAKPFLGNEGGAHQPALVDTGIRAGLAANANGRSFGQRFLAGNDTKEFALAVACDTGNANDLAGGDLKADLAQRHRKRGGGR